jgi:2-succinyl-6-hydroxy-2,4-cyclohexadiene-1-carboxylate synthase
MGPLAAERHGEGPLLVALHGFTQTSSSWEPLLATLSATRSVLTVDLPGHGGSAAFSSDLDGTAAAVAELAGGEPFDVVGYSLGGRIALHLACLDPPTLRRTVAISASPGIVDDDARAARLARDLQMADELEASGDVASFVQRWLTNPMFATLPHERADVAGRATNSASGLADSLRRCSVGTQRPLASQLAEVRSSIAFLAGARDDPFVATSCALAASSRRAVVDVVPGAGHACHLEQPAMVARLIGSFLSG